MLSGDPLQRTYIFRRVDPDGGTPINQLNTVTLRLEPFGASKEPAITVVNLRASKAFRFGGGQLLDIQFDLFNLLNANTATTISAVSGPTYGRISQILNPRIARFGVNFAF